MLENINIEIVMLAKKSQNEEDSFMIIKGG